MTRRWMRSFALAGLAAGMALVGCENTKTPTVVAGPEAAEFGKTSTTTTASTYRLVKGKAQPEDSAVAIISQWGGKLKLGHHTLSVPGGAVGGQTRFVMKYLPVMEGSSYVGVALSATQMAADGSTRRVGTSEAPFMVPLELMLDYSTSSESIDPRRLVILYLVNGTATGELELQTSWIVKNSNFVAARIDHFSKYAVGAN